MDAFIAHTLYNPMPIIGAIISFLAVAAFLLFLRGFLSGVMYLFTLNGNDDFLKPARVRVLWAFLLLVFFFSVWEVVRFVGALLTGGEWPRSIGLAVTLLLILFNLSVVLKFYSKKEKGS